jgi:hypothetical protein
MGLIPGFQELDLIVGIVELKGRGPQSFILTPSELCIQPVCLGMTEGTQLAGKPIRLRATEKGVVCK